MTEQAVIPIERIAVSIYLIRDQKVMLDYDLADLYGVPTKALNQAVSRNKDRFPEDVMLQAFRAGNAGREPVTKCDRFAKAP